MGIFSTLHIKIAAYKIEQNTHTQTKKVERIIETKDQSQMIFSISIMTRTVGDIDEHWKCSILLGVF